MMSSGVGGDDGESIERLGIEGADLGSNLFPILRKMSKNNKFLQKARNLPRLRGDLFKVRPQNPDKTANAKLDPSEGEQNQLKPNPKLVSIKSQDEIFDHLKHKPKSHPKDQSIFVTPPKKPSSLA
jgi:hypothetical protein